MSDLRNRLRTLDVLPQPDLWGEIEARATTGRTSSFSPAIPVLIMIGLLIAVIGSVGLFGGVLRPPVTPVNPSQSLRESPSASALTNRPAQGEWIATGPMMVPRSEGHTVTLLGDGRVLVAGGGSADGLTASAELYVPEAGTWSLTGDMLEARTHHTATLLPDGRVLVVGGGQNVTERVFATAELYDPSTGLWTATASMAEPRQGHVATLLSDGRVLVAGGQQWDFQDGGTFDLASAELYDPITESWTPTSEMPHERDVSTATVLLDGRVLVVGALAQVYDPASAAWTATGSMDHPHGTHTATLLPDGSVLVAGEWFAGLGRAAELYDPETNTWTRTADTIEMRAWSGGGPLADGRVLLAGAGDGGYGGSATAEVYDPVSETWSLTRNMLRAHGYTEGVLLADGRFLVVGGYPSNTDPAAETFVLRNRD